jgi:hypothetical protein
MLMEVAKYTITLTAADEEKYGTQWRSYLPSLLQVESWQGGAKFAGKPALSLSLYRDGFLLEGQQFRPFSDQVIIVVTSVSFLPEHSEILPPD